MMYTQHPRSLRCACQAAQGITDTGLGGCRRSNPNPDLAPLSLPNVEQEAMGVLVGSEGASEGGGRTTEAPHVQRIRAQSTTKRQMWCHGMPRSPLYEAKPIRCAESSPSSRQVRLSWALRPSIAFTHAASSDALSSSSWRRASSFARSTRSPAAMRRQSVRQIESNRRLGCRCSDRVSSTQCSLMAT